MIETAQPSSLTAVDTTRYTPSRSVVVDANWFARRDSSLIGKKIRTTMFGSFRVVLIAYLRGVRVEYPPGVSMFSKLKVGMVDRLLKR